jgi:glycosyltransferase involved in cell wall biosynthesis
MTSRVFQMLDRICVTNCDIVWNLSDEIQKIRASSSGPRAAPEISVPHPIPISQKIKAVPDGPYIAFIGGLRKSQGVDLIIDSLPAIRERVPLVKLLVIGSGPYEDDLKRHASSRGVDQHVEFFGFVASEARVEEILSSCAFGVAPYAPGEASFIWYADPGKIKKYLSCGLPVIVTAGPRFAEYLQKRRAGFAINHDQQALARAAVSLLKEDQTLQEYRRNALAVASEFDVNRIFDNAFLASRKFILTLCRD